MESSGLSFNPNFELIEYCYASGYEVKERVGRRKAKTRATVYGRVWRYCEMEKGYCYESIAVMAKLVSLDRAIFRGHLQVLVSDGFIEVLGEQSRGGRSVTTRYKVTGKLENISPLNVTLENTGVQNTSLEPEPESRTPVTSLNRSPEHQNRSPEPPEETTREDSLREDSFVKRGLKPSRKNENQKPPLKDLAKTESIREQDLPARIAADKRNGRARPRVQVEEEPTIGD